MEEEGESWPHRSSWRQLQSMVATWWYLFKSVATESLPTQTGHGQVCPCASGHWLFCEGKRGETAQGPRNRKPWASRRRAIIKTLSPPPKCPAWRSALPRLPGMEVRAPICSLESLQDPFPCCSCRKPSAQPLAEMFWWFPAGAAWERVWRLSRSLRLAVFPLKGKMGHTLGFVGQAATLRPYCRIKVNSFNI